MSWPPLPLGRLLARLLSSSGAHNTINLPTAEIFFQKSPGPAEGDARGIEGLDFQVVHGGRVVQSGQTGSDGHILMRVHGGTSRVELTFDGQPVAQYTFTVRDDPFEAATEITGVQRRLRSLGYHLGHAGTDSDGIDGTVGAQTDKAILDFQIDQGLAFDGKVGRQTRDKLNDVVGGSAQNP